MNSAIINKNRSAAVTAKVKRLLIRRSGDGGIRALSRALGVAVDQGGVSTITKEKFVAALKEQDITLAAEDVAAVWAEYDWAGNGVIDPVDFLTSLRSGQSAFRRTLFERVWDSFVKNPFGAVELRHLRRAFNPAGHPDVIRGSRKVADIQQEFDNTFNEKTNPEGTVSMQEFEQHYAAVSAEVEDDEVYAALLRGCWNIPGCDSYYTTTLALTGGSKDKSFAAIQPLTVKRLITETMKLAHDLEKVIEQHRSTLVKSRLGFRGLGRLLRFKDTARSGYLSREEFVDALWQNRLYVEKTELLSLLDTNNDNTVDTFLYMNMLVQELPPARRAMLERLWSKFSTDDKNYVDLSEVHKRYKAKDGQALNAFLDAWDKRQVASNKVSLKEFEEWYFPISLNTQMDAAFQQLVSSEWN